jgi:hypothetical protein
MQATLLNIKGKVSWRHLTFDEGEFHTVNPASSPQASSLSGIRAACFASIEELSTQEKRIICYTARFINYVAMVERCVFSCGTSNVGSNVPALSILKEI